VNNVIHHVHQQQRVYLDTLHLLHKSILPDHSHKRFNEPIWFAAQVLYHQCHIRHLESFTELITPFAIQLVEALECVRQVTHSQCVQRTPSFSFVLLFASPSYMKTPCRTTLEPILFKFYQCWVQFEKILYQCYICAVFGSDATVSLKQALPENIKSPLPDVLFHDSFTQLLPMALDRAIQQNVITMGAIQTLDPNMFVAIPRLTLLAGMTWLSHLTGWRRTETVLPMWIQTHEATVHRIAFNLDILEKSILEAGSQEAHLDFVSTFTCLEHTLVSGISEQNMSELEKTIYLDVCSVADAILTSSHAQSFNAILYHLFRYYGLDYQHDDRMDLEDTLASLLI
jgi:hypothetical protein